MAEGNKLVISQCRSEYIDLNNLIHSSFRAEASWCPMHWVFKRLPLKNASGVLRWSPAVWWLTLPRFGIKKLAKKRLPQYFLQSSSFKRTLSTTRYSWKSIWISSCKTFCLLRNWDIDILNFLFYIDESVALYYLVQSMTDSLIDQLAWVHSLLLYSLLRTFQAKT